MKSRLLALLLLAAGSTFARSHVSIGVNFGGPAYGYAYQPYGYAYYPPPPPPPVAYYEAPYARPGYTWIDGYYYPAGPQYQWRPGYYVRPPYRGAPWVAPRYNNRRYYTGYWRR